MTRIQRKSHRLLAGAAILSFTTASTPGWAAGVPAPAMGTLSSNHFQYMPSGCSHNGNRVVCSFIFANQGSATTVPAWAGGWMPTLVTFVDDANVPHRADTAYFVDRYGTQQPQLSVAPGDQGLLVVEFPTVDPRVRTGAFNLSNEVIGPIAVAPAASGMQPAAMPGANANPQSGSYPQQQAGYPQQGYPQQQLSYPQQAAAYPQPQMALPQQQANTVMPQQQMPAYPAQQGLSFPQQQTSYPQPQYAYPANGTMSKTQAKIIAGQQQAAAAASTVGAVSETVQQTANMFKGLFGNKMAPAQTTPAAAIPVSQQVQPQSPSQ